MSSTATTNEITISALSNFLDDYSVLSQNQFLYSYQIKIENNSEHTVQLVSRYLIIIDTYSNRKIVRGEGVMGKMPYIKPSETYVYSSFAPLTSNFGTIEGLYHFISKDGQKFDAQIARFYLASNLNEYPKNSFKRGEVVKHKKYNYRGVVVDFDMSFTAKESIYRKKTLIAKNNPWYHILVDGTDKISYISEQNLIHCNKNTPIQHPMLPYFFKGYHQQHYIRNQNIWRKLQV